MTTAKGNRKQKLVTRLVDKDGTEVTTLTGSCLLWVMSTEISVDIAVDIAVDSRSIVGRQSVDSWSIVGR